MSAVEIERSGARRRDILMGAGFAVAAAGVGFSVLGRTQAPGGVLLLYTDDVRAEAFARTLQNVSAHRVAPLTRKGFAATASFLKQSRGRSLIVLADAAEAVVIERLLLQADAASLQRNVMMGDARVALVASL